MHVCEDGLIVFGDLSDRDDREHVSNWMHGHEHGLPL